MDIFENLESLTQLRASDLLRTSILGFRFYLDEDVGIASTSNWDEEVYVDRFQE